jgi:hypothetical protein
MKKEIPPGVFFGILAAAIVVLVGYYFWSNRRVNGLTPDMQTALESYAKIQKEQREKGAQLRGKQPQ